MAGPYSSYIPTGASEIIDYLGMMMLSSPTFIDRTGFFYDRNVETVFKGLNEGLRLASGDLGEEPYKRLRDMSDRMRAHFEADPEDKTDETLKGRALITAMTDLLIYSIRASRHPSSS